MEAILKIQDVEQPIIPEGKELEEIFILQKQLIEPYIGIEGLPQYPLDMSTKENQIIIKDFVSRVVEELGEAFESTLKLNELTQGPPPLDHAVILPELENFNMECSDALHFMVETLIFLNIGPEDIKDYTDRILKESGSNFYASSTLSNLLLIARMKNNSVGIIPFPSQRGVIITGAYDLFNRGGTKICNYQIETSKSLLWEITYWLQVARNCMKNKAWKQTEESTEEHKLQLYIMEAFFSMIRYFDFMNMTPESIYTIYYKKNKVNMSRIINKY
jgi:hypothetical protein